MRRLQGPECRTERSKKFRDSRPYILVGRVLKVGMVLGCSNDNRNDIDIIDRVL